MDTGGIQSNGAKIVAIGIMAGVLIGFGSAGARWIGVRATVPLKTASREYSFGPISTAPATSLLPLPESADMVYDAFEQEDDAAAAMVMYWSNTLAPEETVNFYNAAMPGRGWRKMTAREGVLNKLAEGIMLYFVRPGRECIVFVEPRDPGSAWTIIVRPVIIGGSSR